MARVKSEAAYQAEWDADTMMRYQEIIGDPKRRSAAMKAAKRKEADLQKSLTNMKKVTASRKK